MRHGCDTGIKTINLSGDTNATGTNVVNVGATDGNFTVTGSVGVDQITGGGGADSLYGAAGNDELNGGAGNDVYHIGANGESYTATSGADAIETLGFDQITDFKVGEDKFSFGAIANGGGSMSYGSNGQALNISYAAGKVYIIETAELLLTLRW